VAQGGPDLTLLERALGERLRVVGLRAVVSPGDDVLEHLGPRPTAREERAAWDAAVGAIAIYREREEVTPDRLAGGVEWAIGRRPTDPERAEDYDRFAALIEPLDEGLASRSAPSAPEGGTRPAGAGVEADAGAPESVEATRQTDSGSSFAALAEEDLVDYANELRRAVAHHERDLERRERAIELRLAHLAERADSGADTTDLEADLTLARERAGEVEGDLRGLAARLAGVEEEAAGRGIDLEAVPLAAQVRRDAEPVMSPELSPAVVPGGPEIGI